MSDLLNSASLVVIPSGYKEDTVYSVVPTDGSGDLSFTRASNGTRVNSAGLVEVCPWNLVQQSETFQTTWTAISATISTNATTAPNGTLTADKLIDNAVLTNHRIQQTTTSASGSNTFSVFAKKSELEFIALRIGSDIGYFNLNDGTFGGLSVGITATTIDAGNGWYRCIITKQSAIANENVLINTADAIGSIFYSGTSGGLFIWGAQYVEGSTAKPYFPTTDRLNVPRLTYQNGGGGCPSLLLEPQRTNLALYSEDFSNAVWTKNLGGIGSVPIVTANAGISPSGTTTADRIQFALNGGTTASDVSDIRQLIAVTSASHTLSFWVKSFDETSSYQMLVRDANGFVNQILVTGVWERYTITSTYSSGNATIGFGIRGGQTPTNPNTADILVWGAQLESGAYPTSYIPTTNASATRVADACFKTGISSLIGQTEGTVFLEFYNKVLTSYPNEHIFQIRNVAGTTQLFIRKENGSNAFTVRLIVAGLTIWTNTLYIPISGINKIAVGYKTGDSAVFANGSQIGSTNTSAFATSSFDDLYFNSAGSFNPELYLNQAILFPTRLTNAELASLTTI